MKNVTIIAAIALVFGLIGRISAAPAAAAPVAPAAAAPARSHFREACLVALRWQYVENYDGRAWVADTCTGAAEEGSYALDVLRFACIADGGTPFTYGSGAPHGRACQH